MLICEGRNKQEEVAFCDQNVQNGQNISYAFFCKDSKD